MTSPEWWRTEMGSSTATTITVAGHDLAAELMGRVSLSELAFRFVAGRFPTSAETRLFDAVLVSLADHGITPSVLAARLTYVGAPEALQGAVAAGILGGGSVFLGVAEDTARFLDGIVSGVDVDDDDALRAAVTEAVAGARARGERTPGLGHPVHKDTDPRVPRLYELAGDLGLLGPHLRGLRVVAEVFADEAGRRLPINGAGAAGAALADLGFDWQIIRGFTLLARTAGILGHLAEEMRVSMGMPLWQELERRSGS
ncbi:MAG TPA: citryl-CoA lyase [Acidimicrobiia bacterium]